MCMYRNVRYLLYLLFDSLQFFIFRIVVIVFHKLQEIKNAWQFCKLNQILRLTIDSAELAVLVKVLPKASKRSDACAGSDKHHRFPPIFRKMEGRGSGKNEDHLKTEQKCMHCMKKGQSLYKNLSSSIQSSLHFLHLYINTFFSHIPDIAKTFDEKF